MSVANENHSKESDWSSKGLLGKRNEVTDSFSSKPTFMSLTYRLHLHDNELALVSFLRVGSPWILVAYENDI